MSSSDQGNRPRSGRQGLYLVREQPPERRKSLITPRELSAVQRERAERVREGTGISGALVGALVGELSWDVQPVVLVGGEMSVVRASDPGKAFQEGALLQLSSFLRRVQQPEAGSGYLDWGEAQGMIWARRPYFQKMLSHPEFDRDGGKVDLSHSGVHPVDLLREVFQQLQQLHALSVYHGHVSISNIAIAEGRIQIVDHGFRSLAYFESEPDEEGLTEASDVLWVARLVELLIGDLISAEQREFLSVAQAPSPTARPDFIELVKAFFPELITKGNVSPEPPTPASRAADRLIPRDVGRSGDSGKMRTGRLIQADQVPAPQSDSSPVIRRETLEVEKAVEETSPEGVGAEQGSESAVSEDVKHISEIQKIIPEDLVEKIRTEAVFSPPKPSAEVPRPTAKVGESTPQGEEGAGLEEESSGPAAIILVLVGILAALFFLRDEGREWIATLISDDEGQVSQITFDAYWSSNRRAQMSYVAEAAILDGDEGAIDTIVQDILDGGERNSVIGGIIRVGFNGLWRDRLNPSDEEILLRFALADLVSEPPDGALDIASAYPAVSIALAGHLPLTSRQEWLRQVALEDLSVLPEPFGIAYAQLAELGVRNLSEESARALTQIIIGQISREALEVYFTEDDSVKLAVGKLRIIEPLMRMNKALVVPLHEVLRDRGNVLTPLVRWFDKEAIGEWANIPALVRLLLVAGVEPEEKLSLEQLADLLRFPNSASRKFARRKLAPSVEPRMSDLETQFLASEKNRLSRYQTVMLVTAFADATDTRFAILARWFETSPDAGSVLELILLRSRDSRVDPFTIDAVRYLRAVEFEISKESLPPLMSHREVLVRTMAYASLDLSQERDRTLLEAAVVVEPVERVRKQLQQRLQLYAEKIVVDE